MTLRIGGASNGTKQRSSSSSKKCPPPRVNRIRGRRRELRLTQYELALRATLGQSTVSTIERGIGNPSDVVLSRIADVLGWSVAELRAAFRGERRALLREVRRG